jgi:hypothetical protein
MQFLRSRLRGINKTTRCMAISLTGGLPPPQNSDVCLLIFVTGMLGVSPSTVITNCGTHPGISSNFQWRAREVNGKLAIVAA